MAKKKYELFRNFFHSEKSGGFILIFCTIISLFIANSSLAEGYLHFWHSRVDLSFATIDLDYSVEHWVNDGLMAIFFLLVGLEIERELYIGELSNFKNALLPIMAAVGGMIFPALIYTFFNYGTPEQSGYGIPMATDIAFALGILSLMGKRVPVALKIFLTALAIIDDLGAIAVIAIFYTQDFQLYYFAGALVMYLLLFFAGKKKIYNLTFYLAGGIIMWYLMLKSGVHATIAGVLLAFAIPFHKDDAKSPSTRLQHMLHYPVAFFILPVFALANTAVILPANIAGSLTTRSSVGIIAGLIAGKFIGILSFAYLSVKTGIANLSTGITWKHIAGVSLLGGIGFTMSIFITNLAFTDAATITSSKLSILLASVCAAVLGLMVLRTSAGGRSDE